jgi:hypothetical protein
MLSNSTRIAALAVAGFMAGVVGSQAMPIANPVSPSDQIIRVRQGCGVGWHRGPYGAECCTAGAMGPQCLLVAPRPTRARVPRLPLNAEHGV